MGGWIFLEVPLSKIYNNRNKKDDIKLCWIYNDARI